MSSSRPLPPPRTLAGWGNYPIAAAVVQDLSREADAAEQCRQMAPLIARGLGRSYGDASLSEHVLRTERFDRLLAFDEHQGLLTCEAGVSFAVILDTFVPRGWFLPVTPGTKYVTVGGAIAADIHGKNHHLEGSFCRYVEQIDLLLASGEVVCCGPNLRPELFDLTRGGMGLTGVILRASFRLKPIRSAYIRQERRRYPNLDAVMDAFERAQTSTYSVAWIDGLARGKRLGRSVLFLGEHAEADELPPRLREQPLMLAPKSKLRVPFALPSYTLNPLTIRAFNESYYLLAPGRTRRELTDYDSFFYPLDRFLDWNRLYGRKGFTQYQFVLPLAESREGMRAILERIAASRQGSFLSVLKLFGPQEGSLSFPREGYTLALDFPIRPGTPALLSALDELVLAFGGRLYLAKDAHMSGETFRASYAAAARFGEELARLDPQHRFRSLLSRRLEVTP